ncbi:MAG: LD-carboxypeptidase [Oscillospiraceae bacterium]|nr:LD-carboxypeptidase [Oscillospiraceae bacterium]
MIQTVAVVSLSSGVLGEDLVAHELEIGLRRLRDYGLTVRFMPHALKGLDYVRDHPEGRAADLLEALRDPEIDMILCAIGGDDTYRLLPYLFEHDELKRALRKKPFLGFSDTTVNHLMLHKVGLNTFYGQSFLSDLCELDREMLPYTRRYFEELIQSGSIREVRPSELWYESRSEFGADQIGTSPKAHRDRGWELLQGAPVFSGRILGGCADTLYDMFDGGRYADMPELCKRYGLFPDAEDWRGRILLLETSEEKMPPETFQKALLHLRGTGLFRVISGILLGKPMDETYQDEYHRILLETVDDPHLPVVANLNIGHATPRCILPFGVEATVDANNQIIRFDT